MITQERTTVLFQRSLRWMLMEMGDEEKFIEMLHLNLGFTKPEIEEFGVSIPCGTFGRMYPNISSCQDAEYLFNNCSAMLLEEIEYTMREYNNGSIILEIPRDELNEIICDGDWKAYPRFVSTKRFWNLERVKVILKWYEGYEDTGYMLDVLNNHNVGGEAYDEKK